MIILTEHVQFFTATVLKWQKLLEHDKYKQIIIDSLKFLVETNRVFIYAYVIMPNHIHLIWQMRENIKPADVQRDFLKYTAQKIKFDLQENCPSLLSHFKVELKDRQYQFWKNRPLSIPLWNKNVFLQKLNYIHNNPIQEKWNLAKMPELYVYSSAKFYLSNRDNQGFLRHYDE